MQKRNTSSVVAAFVMTCGASLCCAGQVTLAEKLPVKIQSEHFVIQSDVPEKDLNPKEVIAALETLYQDFHRRFRINAKASKKLPVLIFSQKDDFLIWRRAVVEQIDKALGKDAGARDAEREKASEEFIGGLYEPNVQIVSAIWEDDRESTLQTLFHETTHHFVHLALPRSRIPIWVNEGLATFFEESRIENGRLVAGIIPDHRLRMIQEAIRQNRHIPLAKFVLIRPEDYNLACYAQGWSLTYFFAKGDGGRYANLYGAFFEELRKGLDAGKAFTNAFAVPPERAEMRWKQFIMSLKPRENVAAAFSHDEQALALHQQAVRAYNEDNYPAALALLDKSLERDGRMTAALILRGRCLFRLERYEAALSAIDHALRLAPQDTDGLFCRALILRDMKAGKQKNVSDRDLDKAWRAVLKADDKQNVARLELALLLATSEDKSCRDTRAAVRLAEDAVRRDDNLDTRRILVHCYFCDGRLDDAIAETRKIIARNPPDRAEYEEMLQNIESHKQK